MSLRVTWEIFMFYPYNFCIYLVSIRDLVNFTVNLYYHLSQAVYNVGNEQCSEPTSVFAFLAVDCYTSSLIHCHNMVRVVPEQSSSKGVQNESYVWMVLTSYGLVGSYSSYRRSCWTVILSTYLTTGICGSHWYR